jgi:hypothetical protein
MLDIAPGTLVVFDQPFDGEIDYTKPQRHIWRTTAPIVSGHRLRIVAVPRYQIQPGAAIDILVCKRAGGEEHFVYSERRESYRHDDQLRIDLFLPYAPGERGTTSSTCGTAAYS